MVFTCFYCLHVCVCESMFLWTPPGRCFAVNSSFQMKEITQNACHCWFWKRKLLVQTYLCKATVPNVPKKALNCTHKSKHYTIRRTWPFPTIRNIKWLKLIRPFAVCIFAFVLCCLTLTKYLPLTSLAYIGIAYTYLYTQSSFDDAYKKRYAYFPFRFCFRSFFASRFVLLLIPKTDLIRRRIKMFLVH